MPTAPEKTAAFALAALLLAGLAAGALRPDYYANICPNLESLVRAAVARATAQSPIAAPATIRLLFHDCAVRGCDASVMLISPTGNDEWRSPDDITLKAEGFTTITSAKAAVDADPRCSNKVSCADIIALAARDSVVQLGGPTYQVELGRYDGKVSTPGSVVLPHPDYSLAQLAAMFAQWNLSVTDLVALSGAHTVGVASCSFFSGRLYPTVDPAMNPAFAARLKQSCPPSASPSSFAFLDTTTPVRFDNAYFYNLQQGMGLLGSDQALLTDPRSAGDVNAFAGSRDAFFRAFVTAITKLGRVGVKTALDGEIRRDCRFTN